MNERLNELMDQTDYNAPGGQWKEYFAELIVKECASICEDHPAWTARMIGNQILEHFGVDNKSKL